MKIEELINQYADDLTTTDTQILDFMLNNKKLVRSLTITELAKKTYTSPSSLTRLAKRLHFSGFSEMKFCFENEKPQEKVLSTNTYQMLTQDINATIKSLEQKNWQPILSKIHDAQNIYVYGTDWGEKIAAQLLVRNFFAQRQNMIFIPSITELKWKVQTITKQDLVFLISYSGKNAELKGIIQLLQLSKAFSVSITPISQNWLSSATDYNIYYYIRNLNLNRDNTLEFNHFSPLYLTIDLLFRKFIDSPYAS
ncbi:MurR/RpiR family transcriptional regulator [Lactobacillus sp. ESL0791]|uniref:MurR/RpiR family transcriptional regulator n=1 Tax=Lactobacillus sp. ESL0791 TaxID=2983234 RepID=UPI0023F8A729|nr:MurR/RpiR family transcriptional regulator [Lactobacillus sp. ESL0791]MDF7637996.1 MurR/RpiR family transcriptional regulator [Lactobacillus sp. ESL0791]